MPPKIRPSSALVVLSILALALTPAAQGDPIEAPVTVSAANRLDYTHELPTGRLVSPVGTVVSTPNFPTRLAILPGGVAVLANGKTRARSVTVFDARTLEPTAQLLAFAGAPSASNSEQLEAEDNVAGDWHHLPARLDLDRQTMFQGLAAGSDGMLYAAGGASDDVLALRMVGGHLSLIRRYPLVWQRFPKGQYPYEYQGEQDRPHLFYPDAVAMGPGGKSLYVAGLLANSLARIDLASGAVSYRNVGSYPFAIAFTDGGHRIVVSDWGGNGVTVLDSQRFAVVGRIATGPELGPASRGAGVHPTAIVAVPGGPYCWVADANVDRLVEVDTRTLRAVRVVDDSPYPGAPPGSYPDGLAIAGNRLFVANAGNDDVAVFNLRTGRSLGLIPTAWYPTDVAADGRNLYVVSAKGLGAGSNARHEWVGNMMDGLVQRIPLQALDEQLPGWTGQALADDGISASQRARRQTANARAIAWLHRHIRYVVFILRENKTFDEELGAYAPAGRWADPHLDLYGPRELPNLYRWAHDQTLFADFMADGEVTSQGHQWTTGTSDSDYVQRTWPEYYGRTGLEPNTGWTQALLPAGDPGWGGVFVGTANSKAIYENLSALGHWSNPWISYPGRLFLFDDLLAHHVPFEDFGEFVSRSRSGDISPAMRPHLAVDFPGWDRMILDTRRAKVAISWLKSHRGAFPRFLYLWLPDDHTAGLDPCYYTPDYYVADNDHATAELVHYLSTTPQWKHMAVFITEDDAQSGADHLDAHRTFAIALGPWVKRGLLETEHLSQVDLVRTMEGVLGLPPMSQWDANATVIGDIWSNSPHLGEVPVLPMQVLPARNPGNCSKHGRRREKVGEMAPTPYTPTTLMTVPGPEQMRQEWIASKGKPSYQATMRYLQHMARAHHAPVGHYLANEDD